MWGDKKGEKMAKEIDISKSLKNFGAIDSYEHITANKAVTSMLCMGCLICGEPVPLSVEEESTLMNGINIGPKICDKCRNASLKMRENIETGDGE